MSAIANVVQVLGGRRVLGRGVTSADELRERTRVGLPYAALRTVMDRYGLTTEEISKALHLPRRTLARRVRGRFRADESDRLLRLARIAAEATQVLGSAAKAGDWLHQPNRALGQQPPLQLLDTDLGTRQVEEVLGRIEHGVFS